MDAVVSDSPSPSESGRTVADVVVIESDNPSPSESGRTVVDVAVIESDSPSPSESEMDFTAVTEIESDSPRLSVMKAKVPLTPVALSVPASEAKIPHEKISPTPIPIAVSE